MFSKIYYKSHFSNAKALYDQMKSFYGNRIVNIVDNDDNVICFYK
jgi:hypothetical protein